MNSRTIAWLAVAQLFLAATAQGQTATEMALAEALYRQARELMAAGNYAEACPKLKESYRIDPATGTLLNLASCHEAEGKFASAWLEYATAAVAARRDRRPDRVKYAEEHMQALEQKLSRLTLLVPAESDLPDLELKLDGVVIGRAARGVPTPVDPGEHVVEASAPGRETWRATVTIGAVADAQSVSVPVLPALAPAVEPAPLPAAASPSVVAAPPPPPQSDAELDRPIPLSVYVAGGTTLALGAAAAITGAFYLERRASYEDVPRVPENDTQREADYDAAKTFGVLNAVFLVGTAGGAAITGYLYATRPATHGARAVVTPFAAPGTLGLVTRGEF
jgi:tetratricopeptide (TPR) repeat protein